MPDLKIAKPASAAEKKTQTTTDTWEFTPATAKTWKSPPFQRPLRVNTKVQEVAQELRENGGIISGMITIGIFEGERWLVDGQHRREAFYQSGCKTGYADVRIVQFDTMADMADEFVKLNQHLVNLKPDDIVRGMESSCPPLAKLRQRCKYVGYDNIRRSDTSPVIAMAQLLRCWAGSANDTPRAGGISAAQLAERFSMSDCDELVGFLDCAFTAWSRDAVNAKLWGALNITLCMWLYRRMHLSVHSSKTTRVSQENFTKCLMSVAAAEIYVSWLVGRQLAPRDLKPCYDRLKKVFAGRLEKETNKRPLMPAPAWATGK